MALNATLSRRTIMAGVLLFTFCLVEANEDAKRLFDDLMVNYNRHRRPANSAMMPVKVDVRLRLSQIIDVHELDQIMTCSVWLKQSWVDKKLSWRPESYGGVRVLYVPYEMIWVPDIVLYNNADNNYNLTISTKATLYYTGNVTWEPPAIFKSMCIMDILWFPFDEQHCDLKIGSWTYPEDLLTLEMELDNNANVKVEEILNERGAPENITVVEEGIDLSDYYPSVEWDIMSRIAKRRKKTYSTGNPKRGSYNELHYCLVLRRQPLYYTVNLVSPCVAISFLTVLVFYLPSDSGEKVSLSINILVALTMFFLLLIELIPANSISLPFVGKYLLFTMILVTLSVITTVLSLQLHFRKPTTHTMSDWIKNVFLDKLPKLLFMRRPPNFYDNPSSTSRHEKILFNYHAYRPTDEGRGGRFAARTPENEKINKIYNSPSVQKSFRNLCFIAELLKKKEREIRVDEDWKYVACVLDRLFLLIFSAVCFFGTGWIIMQAPTFYDKRVPVDLQYRPPELQ